MSAQPDWRARPGGPEYDAVRRRVVDAAESIVRHDGVGALRLDSVADAAGLHRSSLYRYFGSKEELVTAVVVQVALRVGRRVLVRVGESAPPQRLLVEGLSIALAELARDPVYRSLAEPSGSEWLTRVAGNVLTEGIRPLVEPMFDRAAAEGVLRAGVTPDIGMRWLQIVASGLMRGPTDGATADELAELLELMLVPALLER